MIDKWADDYARCGFRFMPLVKRDMACQLDILVLRRDEPHSIFGRGDLDNMVKTLIDGLRMPQQCNELAGDIPGVDDDPFFCLLEDDDGIIEFSAVTDKLLTPPEQQEPFRDVVAVVTATAFFGDGTRLIYRHDGQ